MQLNNACGVETLLVDPIEIKRICPQIDLTGGGRYPVLGASYHVPGSTARHDRVVWAYAQGAMQRGVHVHAEHAGHRACCATATGSWA